MTLFLLWIGTYCLSCVVQQTSGVKDLSSLVRYDDSSFAAIRHVQSIVPVVRPGPNIRSHSVLFRLKSICLVHEPQKRQIPKPSRANCMTIQLTVRAWLHYPGWPSLSGWLALPRWLLSRYYMSRTSPEQIGSNMCEQCVTRCPVSLLVHSPGCLANVKMENFQPGCRHHNTGIPAHQAGSVVL